MIHVEKRGNDISQNNRILSKEWRIFENKKYY